MTQQQIYNEALAALDEVAEATYGDWQQMNTVLLTYLHRLHDPWVTHLIDSADGIREDYLSAAV
jgi:hypothetical protein